MKVSAVQAARLTGRNERRIRDWIATQRLPAIKVGQSWQIDIEDLERIPGIKIDHEQLTLLQTQDASTAHNLLSRISELEQIVLGLHSEITALTVRLDRIERHQFTQPLQYPQNGSKKEGQSTVSPPASQQGTVYQENEKRSIDSALGNLPDFISEQEGESLPPGSIRMKQFALIHKVHAAVLNYQIETGKIEDTSVSTANGRKAHWLTPEQQRAVIAFWRRNGTHFVPCAICPHNNHGSEAHL